MKIASKQNGFTIEDLDKVLSHHSIELKEHSINPAEFDRTRHFKALGVDYKIKWHVNQCSLFTENLQVPFNCVEISGTWPNAAMTNLQFYTDGNRSPCAIIAIENYKGKTK